MKSRVKIKIIDYGVGNLRSLIRAFEHFKCDVVLTEEPRSLENADAIVLPGDGSFHSGIEGLKVRNLTKSVKDFAKSGKMVLGVCLGAQILMTEGREFGVFKGLDLIEGKVVKFPGLTNGAKVPQIGWNKIYKNRDVKWHNTILRNIKGDSSVYFVHSYVIEPKDKKHILALSNYGDYEFCSVIKHGNIYGCQFHPEKSGPVGLAIIKNFIELVKNDQNS